MSEVVLSLYKGLVERPEPRPFPRAIVCEIAAKHGLTFDELTSPCRARRFAYPRQEAMWELQQRTRLSLPQIARWVGRKDHTTAWHGIRAHERRLRERAVS